MRRILLAAGFLAGAVAPSFAQQNPFKVEKPKIKNAEVSYTMTGDMSGTATLALDGDRMARRQTTTTKMMGKTSSTDSWTLTTADSMYMADLTKKQGTVAPNILPHMANAYDGLDDAGKKRLHQNMKDMASMLSKAFSLSSVNAGEKIGKKTYAGQECEEKKFGSFSVCTMEKAPIVLHTQGSLVCLKWEETATAVNLGGASSASFALPQGVTWKQDPNLQKADSMATGMVLYLSSQQLADSLAKAKAELAAAQAKQAEAGQPAKMTPEQEAEMQKACEAIKNFDVGKAIADATAQMGKEIGDAMKRAAVDAAKNAATNKINSVFKKPKIP
jgi:hypothetical protein